MNKNQKHLILVLGMHRSGTSAITRSLVALGVDLGEDLLKPMPNVNEKGFFEDIDFYRFNENLLKKLGTNWHSLAPISIDNIPKEDLVTLKLAAANLLKDRFKEKNRFALKDPRLPQLLEFWQPIFEELNLKVSYIVSNRNPKSVAKSLLKRDNLELERGYYLWLSHMLLGLCNVLQKDYIVVDYDNLIEEPALQVGRIANFLSISFDPNSQPYEDYRRSFLEKTLRHWEFTIEDLTRDESVPASIIELYKILIDLSQDRLKPNEAIILDQLHRLKRSWLESKPSLIYMQNLHLRIDDLNRTIKEKEEKIKECEGTTSRYIEEIYGNIKERNKLNQALVDKDSEFNILNAQLETYTSSLNNILSSHSWEITKPLRALSETIRRIRGRHS